MTSRNETSRRTLSFAIFLVASGFVFWAPLKQLVGFAVGHDYGSHILLIVPVSILLVYLRRDEVFSDVKVNSRRKGNIIAGSSLFLLGSVLLLGARRYPPLQAQRLTIEILLLVVLWISGFVLCYGREAFIRARFPLLFLFLLVPLPDFLLRKAIFSLQEGSSAVAYGLLRILSVPVLKEDFILRLPRVDLEVARECSGIRSSIALLLTVLVAGEFLLHSFWRKLLLVLSVIPILVVKNGVRIVSIYLLTAYVNPAFLHGWLHTSGGILFYLLGVIALFPVLAVFRKGERNHLRTSRVPELAQVSSI
ncbi:MAG: eight transrane protein EpsH [Acidobacteriaceae bacterium]|nr:eight transrane protein EpsH [Acidobacteriaceae bacterium]